MEEQMQKYQISEQDYQSAVNWRRKLHKCPQPSWLEFYATGLVAEKLTKWGYELKMGKEIIAEDKLVMLPSEEKLEEEYQRAIAAGIEEKYIKPARGGFTGVVAEQKAGNPGPTVGFRFDIDCNEARESNDADHMPAILGFASQNPGYAHLCGHDVHTATGLLLAKWFSEHREEINGTIRLIFQPNEENLSGAAAMAAAGVVDGLDYILGGHVGTAANQLGYIALETRGIMAMSRFEVTFTGRSAHAAAGPHTGKNALLGACSAITNLHAISRHTGGATTVNVGYLEGGTTWNVIPEKAYFWLETRGVSDEINQYMIQKTQEVISGAAKMYDLHYEIKPAAISFVAENSPDLQEIATQVAASMPSTTKILENPIMGGSEDFTVFMKQVQMAGGKALFALFGTPICGGHHNSKFDVDERVIKNATEYYIALYKKITE